MLRIAICDPNEATREPLRGLLLGVDFVWLEAEGKHYQFFHEVIRESSPDLVIINLDHDRAKSVLLVAQLAAEYPMLPILAISSDHQAILSALQRGAKFFLTQPVVLEDLLNTLRKVGTAGQEYGGGPALHQHQSTVIAILGSRGGIGCTSLAINLGCALAADPAHAVALVDLDLALGDADVSLDLRADHTIADLAMNIERLDMNFLKRSLVKHDKTSLSLLCRPLQIADIGAIHENHVERILNLLKVSYSHLILDLSKALLPTDLMALRTADKILLVAQLELSSLGNTVRLLQALGNEDGLNEKVLVIMNRVGSEHLEGDISLQKAEEVIGKPIFWQVPNDTKSMMGSRVVGEPLLVHAPRSRVHQSLLGLGQALCGKQARPGESAKTPRPGLFGGWRRKD